MFRFIGFSEWRTWHLRVETSGQLKKDIGLISLVIVRWVMKMACCGLVSCCLLEFSVVKQATTTISVILVTNPRFMRKHSWLFFVHTCFKLVSSSVGHTYLEHCRMSSKTHFTHSLSVSYQKLDLLNSKNAQQTTTNFSQRQWKRSPSNTACVCNDE